MSLPAANLLVSATEDQVFVKITGRANFASSVDFKTLVNGFMDRNFQKFILDLTDCLLMDSTFLGVLAGFGLRLARGRSEGATIGVELLNPNQRVAELLENLGVAHLFEQTEGRPLAQDSMDTAASSSSTPSRQQMSETSLEAHKTLMEINPDNIPRFKDVAQFLAEDLAKIKARSQG